MKEVATILNRTPRALPKARLIKLLPIHLQQLEPQTPTVQARFSHQLIAPVENPRNGEIRYRVGLLTGCVQDLVFSNINRDTADVLLANGCEVHTPPVQCCCGSLHGHNGEPETSRALARRNLDLFDVEGLDAIITNAAGCGSHLKTYGRLLAEDKQYADRALIWSRKCKDISEFLVEIGFRARTVTPSDLPIDKMTYHEACHLCHGQKITTQPRRILVVTANPGCHLQIENGAKAKGAQIQVCHPVSLLAMAYREETRIEKARIQESGVTIARNADARWWEAKVWRSAASFCNS